MMKDIGGMIVRHAAFVGGTGAAYVFAVGSFEYIERDFQRSQPSYWNL